MSRRIKYGWIVAVWLLIAGVLGGTAIRDQSAAEAAARDSKKINAHTRALSVALSEARRRHANALRESQALEENLAVSLRLAAKQTRSSPPRGESDPRVLLQTDPRMQALNMEWNRAEIVADYAPLFRALGLTPDQIRRFEDIQLRMQGNGLDVRATAEAQHLAEDDPAIQKMRSDAGREFVKQREELLCADGARAAFEYERASSVRAFVAGLQGAATRAGVPLTGQQADQLTNTLAQASPSYRRGDWAALNEINWDTLPEAVRPFLTDRQRELLLNGSPTLMQRLNVLVDAAKKADRQFLSAK